MLEKASLDVPGVFDYLFEENRYLGAYGGRGSAKSHSVARMLISRAYTQKKRILCTREFQSSIKDSVHKLLSDVISEVGLNPWFDITQRSIISRTTGSEFIFKGLRRDINEIKSTEGIDLCWVEEAQAVSETSWMVLIPTIRRPKSQIIVTFNPWEETDATYQRFVIKPPPNAIIKHVNFDSNPFFPDVLDQERRHQLAEDEESYNHVWLGECIKLSEARIFRNCVSVEAFDTPDPVDRFYYGLDFGFANDPTFGTRSFIQDDCLYVDYEVCGYHIEIDEIPAMLQGGKSEKTGAEFLGLPDVKRWPIKADCSRPETISFIRRQGLNCEPAEKWSGSVEDGIAHLKGFKKIIVHERCKRLAQEFRLYSFKTDPRTGEVLPIIVDKNNHGIDSLRYALDGYIQQRGGMGVWKHLIASSR